MTRTIRLIGAAGLLLLGTLYTTAPTASAQAQPTCQGRAATIVGTPGPDTIRGTRGRDVIVGLGGRDVIRGLGGNDIICGGGGNDRIFGGPGRDLLVGGPGSDRLIGQGGRDRALGGPAADVCRAERRVACGPVTPPPTPAPFYENCDAVREANAAPIRRDDPGYGPHLDRDNDGIGCEDD